MINPAKGRPWDTFETSYLDDEKLKYQAGIKLRSKPGDKDYFNMSVNSQVRLPEKYKGMMSEIRKFYKENKPEI